MTEIHSLRNMGNQYEMTAPKPELKEQQKTEEPKDEVRISKTREVFEKIAGAPVALITTAANAVGGFLGGGAAGASNSSVPGEGFHVMGTTASYIGMGATAGAMVGGWIGGIVGGLVGAGFAGMSGSSGALKKAGDNVEAAAKEVVSDNKDTGRKLKDGVRDFTEGAIAGTVVGAAGGFVEGDAIGAGLVSGVIEGGKGAAAALTGKYEKTEQEVTPAVEDKPLGKKIASAIIGAPKAVLGTAVGAAMGAVDAAMESVDGAVQGLMAGVDKNTKPEKSFHKKVMMFETVAGGVTAGFLTAGFVGAGVGLVGGLIVGGLINRFEKKSGKAEEIADNLGAAVKHAQSDNAYSQNGEYAKKNSYETFRDGTEGLITGAAAGIREGAKTGYAAGKGIVDGVFEGVGGLFGGIAGGITGKKS